MTKVEEVFFKIFEGQVCRIQEKGMKLEEYTLCCIKFANANGLTSRTGMIFLWINIISIEIIVLQIPLAKNIQIEVGFYNDNDNDGIAYKKINNV